MRMAIVTDEGWVENIIEADAGYDAGSGRRAVPAAGAVGPGWLWTGERFEPRESVAEIPASVSDLQFRLALNALNLRAEAEAIVERSSQEFRDYWDRSLVIHRDHPFIVAAAAALGKEAKEIDDLFRLAATL